MSKPPQPVMLLILDGFGLAPEGPGNAVALAHTPTSTDSGQPTRTPNCKRRAARSGSLTGRWATPRSGI